MANFSLNSYNQYLLKNGLISNSDARKRNAKASTIRNVQQQVAVTVDTIRADLTNGKITVQKAVTALQSMGVRPKTLTSKTKTNLQFTVNGKSYLISTTTPVKVAAATTTASTTKTVNKSTVSSNINGIRKDSVSSAGGAGNTKVEEYTYVDNPKVYDVSNDFTSGKISVSDAVTRLKSYSAKNVSSLYWDGMASIKFTSGNTHFKIQCAYKANELNASQVAQADDVDDGGTNVRPDSVSSASGAKSASKAPAKNGLPGTNGVGGITTGAVQNGSSIQELMYDLIPTQTYTATEVTKGNPPSSLIDTFFYAAVTTNGTVQSYALRSGKSYNDFLVEKQAAIAVDNFLAGKIDYAELMETIGDLGAKDIEEIDLAEIAIKADSASSASGASSSGGLDLNALKNMGEQLAFKINDSYYTVNMHPEKTKVYNIDSLVAQYNTSRELIMQYFDVAATVNCSASYVKPKSASALTELKAAVSKSRNHVLNTIDNMTNQAYKDKTYNAFSLPSNFLKSSYTGKTIKEDFQINVISNEDATWFNANTIQEEQSKCFYRDNILNELITQITDHYMNMSSEFLDYNSDWFYDRLEHIISASVNQFLMESNFGMKYITLKVTDADYAGGLYYADITVSPNFEKDFLNIFNNMLKVAVDEYANKPKFELMTAPSAEDKKRYTTEELAVKQKLNNMAVDLYNQVKQQGDFPTTFMGVQYNASELALKLLNMSQSKMELSSFTNALTSMVLGDEDDTTTPTRQKKGPSGTQGSNKTEEEEEQPVDNEEEDRIRDDNNEEDDLHPNNNDKPEDSDEVKYGDSSWIDPETGEITKPDTYINGMPAKYDPETGGFNYLWPGEVTATAPAPTPNDNPDIDYTDYIHTDDSNNPKENDARKVWNYTANFANKYNNASDAKTLVEGAGKWAAKKAGELASKASAKGLSKGLDTMKTATKALTTSPAVKPVLSALGKAAPAVGAVTTMVDMVNDASSGAYDLDGKTTGQQVACVAVAIIDISCTVLTFMELAAFCTGGGALFGVGAACIIAGLSLANERWLKPIASGE